jgi:hypothetical protein
MAEKRKVVQNPDGTTTIYVQPDVIGTIGEIVGVVGGIAVGGYAGTLLNKSIPAATTILEKVGRALVIGSAVTATEYYVSEGIAKTFSDISDVSEISVEAVKSRTNSILTKEAKQPVKLQTVEMV